MSRATTLWICGGSVVLLALLGGRALVQVGHGLARTWSASEAVVVAAEGSKKDRLAEVDDLSGPLSFNR